MKENRKEIYEQYTGDKKPMITRTFLEYDRYWEVGQIMDRMKKLGVDFKTLHVLDYGCGVADYGIALAREGARVSLFDTSKACVDFATWRFEREGLSVIQPDFGDEPNFVIFGEVLEHCDNPLEALQEFENAEWIFTSSYPYRDDDPENSYWKKSDHREEARLAMKPCREWLESNYERFNIDKGKGQMSLWRKKK